MMLVLLSASCADVESGGVAAERRTRLETLPSVDHTDALAREPMIATTPDGTYYVTGYGGPAPRLWRSNDSGATWSEVKVGGEADGAIGNSDVDLAVAKDGTIYFVAMSYDRARYEGTGISMGVSRDGGDTWKWTALSRDRFDDRPWVEVAPDGTAHVIWNDGSGVAYATSVDRGDTWVEKPRIHNVGGSSHFAISPAGTLAVRITPLSASANRFDAGEDHVAVSDDGGATWVLRDLPGNRDWAPFDENKDFLRWVEPVAWDSANRLYSLWTEDHALWLARSTDHGASWKSWLLVQDTVPLYFPYVVGRGNGELAATWFSGLGASIRANVAYLRVDPSGEQQPAMSRAEAFAFPAFSAADTTTTPKRDTAGEYVAITFLPDSRLGVVTTVQDRANRRYGFTFRPYRLIHTE